jgi:MOSC domain-containing protein YiiM
MPEHEQRGRVVAVHRSERHDFSKTAVDRVDLVAGIGVEGDAHAGARVKHRSRVRADPSQPNLRQVHLIHGELLADLETRGFTVEPGQLGENITTTGLDLLSFPVGASLRLGARALVVLTGLRNPCQQIDDFQDGLLSAVIDRTDPGAPRRLSGVMGVVVQSGPVRPGDQIDVALPPRPHDALERV